MENLRTRRTVELLKWEEKLKKLTNQPSFKQFKIFPENLVPVERAKVELTLNRPIYMGFAILDLSKRLMCDFYYKYSDSTLLFTNTVSLAYQIQTDFYADKHLFDFSGYKKESPFYNDESKKVIGKMNDEFNEEIIEEFFWIEGEDVFIENKERENEEVKESEEERSQKEH